MKNLRGKVAAITGGGSGMGAELAWQLSALGCNIAISDIDEKGMARTQRGCAEDVKVTTFKLDVANFEQMKMWKNQILSDHGAVHLLFNNAGVTAMDTFEHMISSQDQWDRSFKWCMEINFDGVVNGCRAFLPVMVAQKQEACICNTSSIFGLYTIPGQSAYHASKYAVRGFTESLAQECRMTCPWVRVAVVHPGHVGTNIANNARDDIRESGVGGVVSSFLGGGADGGGGTDEDRQQQQAKLDARKENFRTSATTTAKQAAAIILTGVLGGRERILVGPDAHGFDLLTRLFPEWYKAASLALRVPLTALFVLPPTVLKRAYNWAVGANADDIGAVRDPDTAIEEEGEVVQQVREAVLEAAPVAARVHNIGRAHL